jgi:hypothetical protein
MRGWKMPTSNPNTIDLLEELMPSIHHILDKAPAYGEITIAVTFHNNRPTRVTTNRTEHQLLVADQGGHNPPPQFDNNKCHVSISKEVSHD